MLKCEALYSINDQLGSVLRNELRKRQRLSHNHKRRKLAKEEKEEKEERRKTKKTTLIQSREKLNEVYALSR